MAIRSISLFNLLRLPMHLLPNGITEALRLSVSIKRINKFLRAEEMSSGEKCSKQQRDRPTGSMDTIDEYAIEVHGGSFSWGKDLPPAVSNVDVRFPSGALIAVVGR